MNIFAKRPLSIIITLMLSAFFIYANLQSALAKIILSACAVILLIMLFIVTAVRKSKLLFHKITVGAIILTLLFCNVYFDFWFKAYERTDGEEVYITGEITDIERVSSYNTEVTVKTEKISNYKFSSYKIIFFIPHKDALSLADGAKISFNATLCGFEGDESFDAEHYYFSDGYNACAENVSNIQVIEYGELSTESKLADYRTTLSRRAIMLSDYESGSLISALLLGEKHLLSSQVRLDFSRSGLSHALALSGMHLAVLSLGIEKLLGLLGLGKKSCKIANIFFVLTYMALVGFPVSVVRAGIMLILASLFFLTVGSKDSFTNLLMAVLIICFISPYAIYSVSLWLSAFATLGIIVLAELFQSDTSKKKHLLRRFCEWCISAILASVFAIGASFFLMAIYFDGFSWIAIFINPIFSILLEAYLYIGSLALIFGEIIPFKFIISPLRELIYSLLETTSSLESAYLSINYTAIKILITIFTVAFFLFISLKIKRKILGTIVVLLLFTSIYVTAAILNYHTITQNEAFYSSSEDADTLIAKSNGEIMVIETGNNTTDAFYSLKDTLCENNISKIDVYTVTSYNKSLQDFIDKLLSNFKTDTIYLPYPENDSETSIADAVIKNIENFRCKIKFYKNDRPINLSGITFVKTYGNAKLGSSAKVAYTLTYSSRTVSYLSSGMLESSTKEKATELMTKSNAIILGRYGKKYTKLYFIEEEFEKPGLFILSGTRVAFLQSTLQYYHAMGTFVMLRPDFYRLYVE